MEVDFIVFGHGHAGVLRTKEYNGSKLVEFMPAAVAKAIRTGERINPQPLERKPFQVVEHTSGFDNKTYLLAVADGVEPQNVDIRIIHESPRPKPVGI